MNTALLTVTTGGTTEALRACADGSESRPIAAAPVLAGVWRAIVRFCVRESNVRQRNATSCTMKR